MPESLRGEGGRQVLRMRRRYDHPPERVWRALTESDQLRHWFPIEVRLEPRPGGRIVFGGDGAATGDRSVAASYASGWQTCLRELGRVLAGDPRAGTAGPPSAALHEEYVRRFGLDAGSVETTSEGWLVRFDRQLTRSAADLWKALLDADDGGSPRIGGPVPAGFTNGR